MTSEQSAALRDRLAPLAPDETDLHVLMTLEPLVLATEQLLASVDLDDE